MTDVGFIAEASTQKEAWPAKIVAPEVLTPASPASDSDVIAPVAEDVGHDSVAAAVAAIAVETPSSTGAPRKHAYISPGLSSVILPLGAVETSSMTGAPRKLAYISPGLSSVTLPLGPAPKERIDEEGPTPKSGAEAPSAEKEPVVEAKIGDLVESFMGKGQVRTVREDGMLKVLAVGWEMAREHRPFYYIRKGSVKVVPTVYYKMEVLEQLHMAAWLKEEGGRLFKEADYQAAAASYLKAIGVLKTSKFTTNAQNARALEMMIPCHNNAATCYIKIKNYRDARVLSENVDTLCSTLERNKTGLVMKALKERGVAEMTVLGHWWCKGLFLGGRASLYQSETDQAVTSLRKGSKLAKSPALSKLRNEINNELEKATKRLASQTKKAQKMWTKAFSKNSAATSPRESVDARQLPRGMANGPVMPQMSVLQTLEQMVRKREAVTVAGESRQADAREAGDAERAEEDQEEEYEDDDEEEEDDDEDEEDEDANEGALSSKRMLWGALGVGLVVACVTAMAVLRRRGS